MAKTYVIDTNVLIQAPNALLCFEENQLVLPLVVLEELDGLKKAEGERGYNARQVIRTLEDLRRKGDLIAGVPLPNGGTLRVETKEIELDENICSMIDYFEIFLDRMLMCKRAAEVLGLRFKMTANGNKIC